MEFEGVPCSQEKKVSKTGNTSEDVPAPSMDASIECNICLDFVVDPVVTLCGHLFCWPCIYRWMQLEGPCHQQCPVCKALLSKQTLVPLYGRGRHNATMNSDIPRRPTFCAPLPLVMFDHDFDHYQPMQEFPVLHPTHYQQRQHAQVIPPCSPAVGGLAIATLNMMCGNHGLNMHGSDHLNHLTLSGGNPRLRRQLKQVEKSLHQIWLLLFLFVAVCIFLF